MRIRTANRGGRKVKRTKKIERRERQRQRGVKIMKKIR